MPFTEYADFMTFPSPEANLWRPDLLTQHLAAVGARYPHATQRDVDDVLFCYNEAPRMRTYHDEHHGSFVGQPYVPPSLLERMSGRMSAAEIEALLAIGGKGHDAGYKDVDVIGKDARLWPEPLERRIGRFATPSVLRPKGDRPLFMTTLTPHGQQDPTTRAVANIFNMKRDGLSHVQGSNEFDSGLGTAQFLRWREARPKSILAAAVVTACTFPFQTAIEIDRRGNVTGGYTHELAWRLRNTSLRMGSHRYRPDWTDVNDLMLMGVYMGNRDLFPLMRRDNFHNVIRDGRALRTEGIPELRIGKEITISQFVRTASIERSVAFLYRSLAGIGRIPVHAADVPNIYIPCDEYGVPLGLQHAYPPYEVYLETVADVERNARLATLFFQTHEVGIATAAAIATLAGEPDAPVPGFVDAVLWPDHALPRGRIFENLDNDIRLVFDELMFGAHQEDVSVVVSQRSPISGLILGASGYAGVQDLSAHIQDIWAQAETEEEPNPFSQTSNARALLKHVTEVIGHENFQIIIDQLKRVARNYQRDPHGNPDRERKIDDVGKEFWVR